MTRFCRSGSTTFDCTETAARLPATDSLALHSGTLGSAEQSGAATTTVPSNRQYPVPGTDDETRAPSMPLCVSTHL